MTTALLMEIYKDYGVKFEDATEQLNKSLSDKDTPPARRPAAARAPNNDQSMALLQAAMRGSSFGGPKG